MLVDKIYSTQPVQNNFSCGIKRLGKGIKHACNPCSYTIFLISILLNQNINFVALACLLLLECTNHVAIIKYVLLRHSSFYADLRYYKGDPVLNPLTPWERPPIKNVFCIYGIDLKTEV
jgi:hypothetical protein